MENRIFKELVLLRRELHHHPELSGCEIKTRSAVKDFVSKFCPNEIIEGYDSCAIAFIYDSCKKGPVTVFRADLDALPIVEINDFIWRSDVEGVSHKCGHDGHMTILCGLAVMLSENPPEKGKVVLLFQPAEETGEGALSVLNDCAFKSIVPDYVFSLHNVPLVSAGKILCKKGVFAAASVGLIIRIFGKTSHAAEPSKGKSPSLAMASIVNMLESIVSEICLRDFALVTPVYVKMGEKAFGTTPGYAEIMATLRAFDTEDLQSVKEVLKQRIISTTKDFGLGVELEWVEEFSATVNNKEAVSFVRKAAEINAFEYETMAAPNRWSEDVGCFHDRYKGAIFGLGAGVNVPKLHNPDYDFPEEIIPYGVQMFCSLVDQLNR